jgi:hypothetical protein
MAILQKRSLTSGSIPTTSSLAVGEIAMNVPDGRIYLRKSGSGSDTIQSAITTGAQNSGSIFLTGSLSISGTGSVFDVAGDVLEFSGDQMEFTGSFVTTGSMKITGSLSVSVGTVEFSGDQMEFTGSFITSGSLRVIGDTAITGSLRVSGSITGSLFGTSSFSTTASFATSASWSTSQFPYTGSAIISGSLTITGSLRVSGSISANAVTLQGSGSTLMLITGSRGELFKVLDSGSTSILAIISSGSINVMTVTTSSVDVVGSMSVTSTLRLSDIVDPTSFPSTGSVIYSRNIAGRSIPKYVDTFGIDYPFQTSLVFNNTSVIGPGGGTTVNTLGCTVTNVGTISNPNIATTNLKTQTRRIVNTSAATAGSLASIRVDALECFRGNAAGIGGFFVVCRFGLTTLATGNRAFFGLSDAATTAPTNVDPLTSVTIGKIGMACSASTGNWSFVNNVAGTSPTVLALGTNFPVDTTTLYEMVLSSKPNDTIIGYRLTNLSSSVQLSGSVSLNIPANTTPLGRQAWMTNNATAAAIAFDLSRFSLETDY